ncbi:hypothetical protein [Brevundimonas bullata]
MTSFEITCPPGVALLLSDRAHARAIENLWSAKTAIPHHLPPGEWTNYGRAWLTAQTVKVDLLAFMHQAWMLTWGQALEARFPKARLLSQQEAEAGNDPFVWVVDGDNARPHAHYIAVDLPGLGELETAIALTEGHELTMWFGALGPSQALAPPWTRKERLGDLEDDADGYFYAHDLAEVSAQGGNVRAAYLAAKAAIEAL